MRSEGSVPSSVEREQELGNDSATEHESEDNQTPQEADMDLDSDTTLPDWKLTGEEAEWPLSRLKLLRRSAPIHEVVPMAYQNNHWLRGAVRRLEEELAAERAKTKRLHMELEQLRAFSAQ
ncbi:hypothetical protein BT96DRAFT_941716 [Gymnopus androsaceus JB14]|uniref:Uncharacterized protein n=1 Tax=Gymnopus androsaceus JB14 TaxID=1447944 RepID=A0A6A4HFC7_9AGAR|nr:hypothetical protein BT96DRAFT_941716 [Gymnopus androsaceus JB14]